MIWQGRVRRTRPRRWACAALVVIFSGCRDQEVRLRIDEPGLEGRASALILATADDVPIPGLALEGSMVGGVVLSIDRGAENIELRAIGYDVPLRALGLESGPVLLGARRSVPAADIAFEGHFEPSTAGGWARSDRPAGRWAELSLAQTFEQACDVAFPVKSQIHRMTLPGASSSSKVAAALRTQDGALLGMRDGAAYLVAERSVRSVPELSSVEPYLGGTRDSAGELWIARKDVLLRGPSTDTLERLPPFPGHVTYNLWLDVERTASAIDVLALSDEGVIARFDGSSWTVIDDIVQEHDPADRATGGIRHLPGGRAVVMVPVWFPCSFLITCAIPLEHREGSRVLLLEADALTEYPSTEMVAMSLALADDGDILIGTFQGALWRRSASDFSGPWSRFGDAPGGYIWSLTPFAGGILVGTGRGEFQPWFPRLGLCPTQSSGLGHIRYVVRLEDRGDQHLFVLGIESDIVNGEGGEFVSVISW